MKSSLLSSNCRQRGLFEWCFPWREEGSVVGSNPAGGAFLWRGFTPVFAGEAPVFKVEAAGWF